MLKHYLKINNVSINNFSKLIGVSRIAVYKYLTRKASPNLLTAMKIRKLTGLKFNQILNNDDYKKWKEFMREIDNELL